MMNQAPHFGAIDTNLENFVRVLRPTPTRRTGIAWGVGFYESPSILVRGRNMGRERPIKGEEASLVCVRKADFDDAIGAHRLRISSIRPQQYLVAVEIACNIHMTAGSWNLTLKVHVGVEELDSAVAPRAVCVPGDGRIVVSVVRRVFLWGGSRVYGVVLDRGLDVGTAG